MVKAKLIMEGVGFKKAHDITYLLDLLENELKRKWEIQKQELEAAGVELDPDSQPYNLDDFELARDYAAILTEYESKVRYPVDGLKRKSPEDAEEAVIMAYRIPYLIGLFEDKKSENLKPTSFVSWRKSHFIKKRNTGGRWKNLLHRYR